MEQTVPPVRHDIEWSDPQQIGQALLGSEETDSFGVSNLDAFFIKVYNYYLERGFWCIVAGRITNLLTLAFTICFSTFLLVFVNWSALANCKTETTCQGIIGLRQNVFSNPTGGEILVFLYFSIFTVYWGWNLLSLFYAVRDSYEMSAFFHDKLHIHDEELESMEWFSVVEKIVVLQERLKLCIVKDLTALDITNRIMRKENYMIAIINLQLLDLRSPLRAVGSYLADWCGAGWAAVAATRDRSRSVTMRPKPLPQSEADFEEDEKKGPPSAATADDKADLLGGGGGSDDPEPSSTPPGTLHPSNASTNKLADGSSSGSVVFGKTLEWNIQNCILNNMFDEQFAIRKGFFGEEGIAALKSRFRWMGVLNLLFQPFIMIFMVVFFFLKHAEELHSKKTVLGLRQWTPLACWKLREFNELSHFFQRRLNASHTPSQNYISQFPSTLTSIIAQCIAYLSGAIVGILLFLTFADSTLLLNLRVWDRTLLWYLACFSAVLAVSRGFISGKGVAFNPRLAMQEVVKHTHYMPRSWRNRTHTYAVLAEFTSMYKYRAQLFLDEVVSVILAPFVLFFIMPGCARQVVEFVQASTVNVNGVGHLCAYAMFDFKRCGDKLYSMNPSAALLQRDHTDPADPSGPITEEERRAANEETAYEEEPQDEEKGGNERRKRRGGAGRRDSDPKDDKAGASKKGGPSGGKPDVAINIGGKPLALRPLPSRQGKMEKSFLTFAINHPHWRTNTDGSRFLSHVASLGAAAALGPAALRQSMVGSMLAPSALRRRSSNGSTHTESPTHSPASTSPLHSNPATVRPASQSSSSVPKNSADTKQQQQRDTEMEPLHLDRQHTGDSESKSNSPKDNKDNGSNKADSDSDDKNSALPPAASSSSSSSARPPKHRSTTPTLMPTATGMGLSRMLRSTTGGSTNKMQDLSQSDRHLIQSFADLLALNPSSLLPEINRLERQDTASTTDSQPNQPPLPLPPLQLQQQATNSSSSSVASSSSAMQQSFLQTPAAPYRHMGTVAPSLYGSATLTSPLGLLPAQHPHHSAAAAAMPLAPLVGGSVVPSSLVLPGADTLDSSVTQGVSHSALFALLEEGAEQLQQIPEEVLEQEREREHEAIGGRPEADRDLQPAFTTGVFASAMGHGHDVSPLHQPLQTAFPLQPMHSHLLQQQQLQQQQQQQQQPSEPQRVSPHSRSTTPVPYSQSSVSIPPPPSGLP